MLRCIYCGMCEEACPCDAIELTEKFNVVSTTRARKSTTRRSCSRTDGGEAARVNAAWTRSSSTSRTDLGDCSGDRVTRKNPVYSTVSLVTFFICIALEF
jgi:formate hydrogenlyase subunit 6/NADH:ubiquinone oxidoreductase subunit I